MNLKFEGACTAVHIFPTITFSVRTTIMINLIIEEKWPRPKIDQALTLKQPRESLPFQLIDLDYIFGICVSVFILKFNILEKTGIIVRLFGVTRNGNSLCVNVHGYKPYFYAKCPDGFGTEHIELGIKTLNNHVKVNINIL